MSKQPKQSPNITLNSPLGQAASANQSQPMSASYGLANSNGSTSHITTTPGTGYTISTPGQAGATLNWQPQTTDFDGGIRDNRYEVAFKTLMILQEDKILQFLTAEQFTQAMYKLIYKL